MLKRLTKELAGLEDDEQIERLFKVLRKASPEQIVRVGTVFVDIAWTVHRRTACGEGLCMAEAVGHKRWEKRLAGKTCCTSFEVPLTKRDVERVAKIVDEVRQIRDVDEAIENADGWWKVEDNELGLEHRPNGACVFLSAPVGGAPLCTIHEWAIAKGENYRDHKPEACCLYPLYTVESGETILITSYGSPIMRLMEPDQADRIEYFDCTRPPKGVGRSVLIDQHGELEYRLGEKRWARVLKKLRALGHPV